MFYIYIYICVCIDFCVCVLILILSFFLSNADMDSNDGIYYNQVVENISREISSLSHLWNKFDRKHGFHPAFIDEHLCVLDEMKMNVKYLLHVQMREARRKFLNFNMFFI